MISAAHLDRKTLTHRRIISQVLSTENIELRKRVKQIEQSKDVPQKSQLDLLREYSFKSADEQQKIRKDSGTSLSCIADVQF